MSICVVKSSMYFKCEIALQKRVSSSSSSSSLEWKRKEKKSKSLKPSTKSCNVICKSVITFNVHIQNVLHNIIMRGICCLWAYLSSIRVDNLRLLFQTCSIELWSWYLWSFFQKCNIRQTKTYIDIYIDMFWYMTCFIKNLFTLCSDQHFS